VGGQLLIAADRGLARLNHLGRLWVVINPSGGPDIRPNLDATALP
jgi:hypothetical protein